MCAREDLFLSYDQALSRIEYCAMHDAMRVCTSPSPDFSRTNRDDGGLADGNNARMHCSGLKVALVRIQGAPVHGAGRGPRDHELASPKLMMVAFNQ